MKPANLVDLTPDCYFKARPKPPSVWWILALGLTKGKGKAETNLVSLRHTYQVKVEVSVCE